MLANSLLLLYNLKCRDAELNCGHGDFQPSLGPPNLLI